MCIIFLATEVYKSWETATSTVYIVFGVTCTAPTNHSKGESLLLSTGILKIHSCVSTTHTHSLSLSELTLCPSKECDLHLVMKEKIFVRTHHRWRDPVGSTWDMKRDHLYFSTGLQEGRKQFNDEGIFATEKQPDIVQRFWDSNGAVQHFDKLLNVSGFQFSLFKTEPIKQSTGMNWQSLSV